MHCARIRTVDKGRLLRQGGVSMLFEVAVEPSIMRQLQLDPV